MEYKNFKKKSGKIFGYPEYHVSEFPDLFPNLEDKAVPNNFVDFDEAINNNEVKLLNAGSLIEIGGWFYNLMMPASAPGSAAMHFAERITPISYEKMMDILNPPATGLQRILEHQKLIFETVIKIHQDEYNSKKYFHNLGFGLGEPGKIIGIDAIKHASSYPENEEAIKLARWRESCWVMIVSWFEMMGNGSLLVSDFTPIYVKTNLPKVGVFFEN